jgi:hypothetical protein
MRKYLSHWLFSLSLIGLVTLLAACSASPSPTTSTPDAAGKVHTSSATQTNLSQNPVGTLSVMASGGLSGPYSFIDPVNMGTSQITPMSKAQRLMLGVRGRDGLSLNITVLPYTGPGSYTLSNTYTTTTSQTIDITVGTKVWGGFIRQSPHWTCALVIASDTPASVSVAGSSITGYHEIKGKFSCSKILSALNTDAPVSLTNGQLDLFAHAA